MGEHVQLTVLHVHFWADIRNAAGSVEKVIMGFAAHGASYRHHIACCPGDGATMDNDYEYQGVAVSTFHEDRLRNRVLNKVLGLRAFTYPSLIRLIHRLRPDVLHFHNRQELVDAVLKRLDYRPAICVHYHRHFAAPVIPMGADRLVFVSNATRAYIYSRVRADVPDCVVYNPLSADLLARAEISGARMAPSTLPVLLFGGGGSPIKGGAELIEAFCSLGPGRARLVLAGRGVENLASTTEDIEVVGEVSAEQFFTLMKNADAVVMPSYYEPFGLIAQEAMLMRRLLITTGSGGLAEFVDADCAVLSDGHEPEALRDALNRALILLRDAQRRDSVIDNAYARMAGFMPEKIVVDMELCYDAAVHASQGTATA
ncbi:MAG: glycosyltransferase family 4 protein [Gammaproteobacteria bacterium]|nr:glycosyltransferase family 4 protein [Gammaproteobacteria bacterium]MCP5137519.1 glycosyltransferase family 4 protein [Gammaproteobacteria bacterium]